jgi:hypothetical protein
VSNNVQLSLVLSFYVDKCPLKSIDKIFLCNILSYERADCNNFRVLFSAVFGKV